MRRSDSIANLAAALVKAQHEARNAVKSGLNPHFKNKYAPLEEVVQVAKDALNTHGIAFVQGGEPTEGDTLSLSTMLLHTSGEWIESNITMRPVRNDPQGIGSCITYARRYALAAICGIASDDDDDANAASETPPPPKPKKEKQPTQEEAEHEGALALFRSVWSKLPKSIQSLDTMTGVLPVSNFDQVKACSTEQLREGIDKVNAILTEAA
jgi:hypothetical protein